jgi:hypothetical protein
MTYSRNDVPAAKALRAAVLVASLLSAASPALGVNCHCFRDRSYDPANPEAVEPYLRATAGNSLLAVVYGVPKGDLVRALMGGTAGADLWVAHAARQGTGRDASALLAERAAGKGWPAILGEGKGLGENPRRVLAAGGEPVALAGAIVDEVLVARLGIARTDLAALRKLTPTYQETILAVLTSAWAKRPAAALAAEVKAGRTSWGALLHAAGIPPDQIDTRLPGLLR